MFKKIAMSTSVLAMAFASSAALATPQTHDIEVIADIPSADFYVQPVSVDTVTLPQRFIVDASDPAAPEVKDMVLKFKAKSAAGGTTGPAIMATLNGPTNMVSGANTIDLNVKFNGVPLVDGAPTSVVDADAAVSEMNADMEVSAVKPGGGYPEGNYRGNVNVTFDAP